jgi:zinc-finger of a C2HC-type
MFEYYNRISLYQCPHCGRSFNEEAFARHATMCTAETPGGPHAKRAPGAGTMGSGPLRMAASAGAGSGSGPAQKPRAYTCYLCGQQYGSKSLPIHVPQCQEKWVKKEETKSKADRRRLPACPLDLDEPLPLNGDDIDAFNMRMFDIYNGVSLCQCVHCGRSFNSEAFERHKKLCTAETPGGPHAMRAPGQGTMGSGPSRLGPPEKAVAKAEPKAEAPPGYKCYLCALHTP